MKMTSMARMGSSGNTKLLGKYGGKHKDRPYKFANGGSVPGATGPRKAYADGGPIDGMPARARLDRPGKKGKDKKGGHTTVNVVVAGKGGGDGAPPMPMPPPGAGPGGPPMPPPGPGMPMRARGGRIANLGKYAHGGRVKRADGGWTGEGDSGKPMKEKAADLRSRAEENESGAKKSLGFGAAGTAVGATGPKFRQMGMLGKSLKGGTLAGAAANLGMAGLQKLKAMDERSSADKADKAGDEAEGRKKGGAVSKYAKGGRITMTAGACSGEGREEKSEAVEKRFGKK